MNRIAQKFDRLKQQHKKALIPYITAGDPQKEFTVSIMHELVKTGADIIELGIPFSDPMAEGSVIQAAHERALKQGITLQDVLAMVKKFRETDQTTPVVLMGYLNPIEQMGYKKFAEASQKAGADGVLIVDLPPEEAKDLSNELKAYAIDLIFLIAPTTSSKRMQYICENSHGYHYCISLKGVTGAGHLNIRTVQAQLMQLKKYAQLPIAVGFGIRDAQSAKAVAQMADGIIIGAALVEKLTIVKNATDLKRQIDHFLSPIRQALDE